MLHPPRVWFGRVSTAREVVSTRLAVVWILRYVPFKERTKPQQDGFGCMFIVNLFFQCKHDSRLQYFTLAL
jgi:hypothetical protein